MNGVPLLEMRGISKEFPGVKALSDVSFDVRVGEVHALCGENGAGKSTLMKILSGFYPAGTYSGGILVRGEPQTFKTIRESERAGISIIYQELSLIPEMTVAENIFIGHEPNRAGIIRWQEVYAETRRLLDSIGLPVSPGAKIKSLGIGQQQLVEIAKAVHKKARIFILDEPTSALTQGEVETLMKLLKKLRAEGVGCVLISHKLDEVFEIADRITVLRDGKTIATDKSSATSEERVISHMVGRELKQLYPRIEHTIGEEVFSVSGLTVAHPVIPGRKLLDGISFSVRKGEILGIAGLMGAGRTELLMALFGALPYADAARVRLEGKEITIRSPYDAIRNGINLVAEDRKRYGLVLEHSVLANMTLAALEKLFPRLLLNRQRELVVAEKYRRDFGVKTPSLATQTKNLSGGNQQKVLFSKCLMTKPRVLFLDEPTRGIDVGAKSEIYSLMERLAAEGQAVVMVSSELPEVLGVSDRILVLREGKIEAEFWAAEATQEKLMAAATGYH